MFSHLLFILDGVFFRNLLHEIIRLERNRTRICHFINKYFVFGSFRVPVLLQSSVLTVHVHFCFTFWFFEPTDVSLFRFSQVLVDFLFDIYRKKKTSATAICTSVKERIWVINTKCTSIFMEKCSAFSEKHSKRGRKLQEFHIMYV